MVHEKHVQTGMPLEQAVDELQRDFEHAMETVVSAIRTKHNTNEEQMTAAMEGMRVVLDNARTQNGSSSAPPSQSSHARPPLRACPPL